MRVYEISKKLGTTSKRVMELLKSNDIYYKNHMSFVDHVDIKKLLDYFESY